MPTRAPVVPERLLLVGFGLANQAAAAALLRRGHSAVATDDRPSDDLRDRAQALGLSLVEAPDESVLADLLDRVDGLVAAPGLPERHPVFALAAARGLPSLSEFDLAAAWDDRPIAAITGTNGKTTVTTLVTRMLTAGGIACVDAGNNDLPLVEAIEDPTPEWFVVEASSFRLARAHDWAPRVATWLNLAPDHLDVHASHADYEAAKARIWAHQGPDAVAVGVVDDPVVATHLAAARARQVRCSTQRDDVEFCVRDGALAGPDGPFVALDDLPQRRPHELANALAAAATAHAAGCPLEAAAATLRAFDGLAHRLAHVRTLDGVDYFDDSKATVPHATLTALAGFGSAVLIAGGRNKGLDLSVLADAAERVRAVVAIGDSAPEIVAAFAATTQVVEAGSMAAAVDAARALAHPGDAVLLSPACASYDWYPNYGARGDDFAACVHALEESP